MFPCGKHLRLALRRMRRFCSAPRKLLRAVRRHRQTEPGASTRSFAHPKRLHHTRPTPKRALPFASPSHMPRRRHHALQRRIIRHLGRRRRIEAWVGRREGCHGGDELRHLAVEPQAVGGVEALHLGARLTTPVVARGAPAPVRETCVDSAGPPAGYVRRRTQRGALIS